jgi:anti-sigma factor RsiW
MMKWTVKKLLGMVTRRQMSCAEVGMILQHYLDGELDDTRARRLAHHLDDCRRCGLEADTYERIKVSLADRRAPVPPDSLARLREFSARIMNEGIAGLGGEP